MFGKKSSVSISPQEPKHDNKVSVNEISARLMPDRQTAPKNIDPPLQNLDNNAEKKYNNSYVLIQEKIFERIDASAAAKMNKDLLLQQIANEISLITSKLNLFISKKEQNNISQNIVDNMLGLGPLENLLADDTISDILVNGPNKVFVERAGRLELTDVKFNNPAHLFGIAQKVVSKVGRKIDESNPICDARLEDGSRINVICHPLAIDGCSISIRKFSKRKITLDSMVEANQLSHQVAQVLKIAAACRLNIVISGGTGSGKTTLLNALSKNIDPAERVITIEDAAELQLQQPHVVRLETRPTTSDGGTEVNTRDLVRNALRMRPDRIICGEVRGCEALDMLHAMNTGHDGSMCTLHANNPREALLRIENMILMGQHTIPTKTIRSQIASAINIVVQISRMRDGQRRIISVSEVTGIEDDTITMQNLFSFKQKNDAANGMIQGYHEFSGIRPHFIKCAEHYNLVEALVQAIG